MVNFPILAVIPARGGSKGIPQKNLYPLGGVPLIAHTIVSALESGIFNNVVVSTDCPKIAEVAEAWGAQVPSLRPLELATDTARTLPVVQHSLHEMEDLSGLTYSAVYTLEPTSPLRSSKDIKESRDILISKPCDSVVGLVELLHAHPIQIKRVEDGYVVPFVLDEPEGIRRQDLQPRAFIRSGAIYATKRETLTSGSLLGTHCAAYIMPAERSISIDNEIDLLLAECLLHRAKQANTI